jgi:zinc/manganese transport system permease protein
MSLELQILLPAFCACLVLSSLLSYLGLHVLARGVIFVDIALAQIAALGTAFGASRGVEPHTLESWGYSMAFTFVGAAVFALTRRLRRQVPQEAFIGTTYAVAAATAVLIANTLPHGDEEIKEILIGSLLTVTMNEVGVTAAIFVAVGAFHLALRKRFLALSFGEDEKAEGWNHIGWDLAFYMSFGVVIASSVHMAGVLLVFSFLVVPAVFSALFTQSLWLRLVMAWVLSAVVSATGLWASFKFDWPTGAAVVVTFGAALVLGAIGRLVRRNATT